MVNHGPQRSIAKNSALKLITSFDNSQAKAKFFSGTGDDGKTPIAGGATPIVESALSPGGADPMTAILRGNRSQFNTPASARPIHGFDRQRLPSIGEAPDSAQRELLTAVSKPAGDPYAAAVQPLDDHDNAANTESTKAPPPPSPSPAAVAALMEGARKRNGSRSRIPEGLDLSLPSLNDSMPDDLTSPEQSAHSAVRYHWPSRRRGPGSIASSVTSAASSVASRHRGHGHHHGRSLDDYIHSLDAAQSRQHGRGSSRDGRHHGRDVSQSRREDRETSRDRGRATARGYTPKGGKRSPKSPVPMSPEDLINLATPKESVDKPHDSQSRGQLVDVSNDELEPSSQPSTVRKVGYSNRDGSRVRGSSRAPSRSGRGSSRARSPDKHRMQSVRGRSTSRGEPSRRSPTSPQPMSTQLQPHYYGSDDEEDYRRAIEDRERFRRRNNRSTSRSGRGDAPTSPGGSVRATAWSTRDAARERPHGIRRSASHAGTDSSSRRKIGAPLATPAPMQLVTDSSGDLKVIKDERQLKKEAAARELEERRKSLARRPSAPPILHPDEITPAPASRSPPMLMELPSTTYVPPKKENLPSRSASVDHSAGRSMFAQRNGPQIGLPANPRAMRLVMESESAKRGPNSQIPSTFAEASPEEPLPRHNSPGKQSPKKEEKATEGQKEDDVPMLLPSTVYTPPPPANSRLAAQIGRSMSAPPQDLAPPEGNVRGPSAMNGGRRPSHDASAVGGRRPSHDASMPPPPPPPAPPMLKELQHLAQPPPPPPAPLAHLGPTSPKPVVYGGSSGMIEIVMDDDQQQQHQEQQKQQQQEEEQQQQQHQPQQASQSSTPAAVPVSEKTVPIISPPAPRNGHSRGRSSTDNSIGARLTRATERMRSVSRNRLGRDNVSARAKSPEIVMVAPYESVPPPPMAMNYRLQNQVFQQIQAQVAQQQAQNEYRTGLHQSEMI